MGWYQSSRSTRRPVLPSRVVARAEISQVEMNVFHTLMYKTNHVVKAEKWQDMLSRAYVSISSHSLTRTLTLLLTSRYVWFDWSSMPQPSACPPSTDKKVKETLGTNLGKAVKSIPAYVNHFSFHTPLQLTLTNIHEQIRREIRLCRDRGPRLSSF